MTFDSSPCERCDINVVCSYGTKMARGMIVKLADGRGTPLYRQTTDKEGRACLNVETAGEYIIKIWSPYDSEPKAYCCRIVLTPGSCKCLRFSFHRPLHAEAGIRIVLRDAYYPKKPLPGGVYQLWRTY